MIGFVEDAAVVEDEMALCHEGVDRHEIVLRIGNRGEIFSDDVRHGGPFLFPFLFGQCFARIRTSPLSPNQNDNHKSYSETLSYYP